jgi:putative flippase GtrA
LLLRQFLTFAGVGVVAAVAHYGVLIVLVEIFKIAPVIATLWGFLAGAAVSYWLNRHFTFRSDRPHREAAPRFLAVSTGGFVLNGLIMFVLNEHWGVPYLLAQVIATLIVLVWNFSANRLWTFRDGTDNPL